MSEARFWVGDVFERMADIPDGSIDAVICSPPFLALRSYLPSSHPDKAKEIGSEATPADFLSTLLALTREWRRVLAPHGSLCVELGDTYSGSGGAGGDYGPAGLREGQPGFNGSARAARRQPPNTSHRLNDDGSIKTSAERRKLEPKALAQELPANGGRCWPLDKSLCLLPTLYPASLAYGRNLLTGEPCEPWRIRNQIVWHRPNPPVGALGDKVRPSTSYVTVACTSRTRWFDLDAERTAQSEPDRVFNQGEWRETLQPHRVGKTIEQNPAGAPPLDCWHDATPDDVWTLSTQPYKGSHYATFPITLPRKLINLMCPRQVCTICGEPRRRIVEVDETVRMANRAMTGYAARDGREAGGVPYSFATPQNTTLGWSDCGHSDADNHIYDDEYPNIAAAQRAQVVDHGNNWRRGIVLDPFAGSGTTLVAASELGRDSIGIDLDERNHQLARERCGMFLIDEPAEAAS